MKDASLSSASATRYSPAPRRAFDAALFSRPPMTNVGSSPPSASTLATRLVVVVLPCVPATAIEYRKRISSPSISARFTTGMRCASAWATSGFSVLIALETTTTSAPATFSARCPTMTRAPRLSRRRVDSPALRSDPCTA